MLKIKKKQSLDLSLSRVLGFNYGSNKHITHAAMDECTHRAFTDANEPRNIIKGLAFLERMHITLLFSCQIKLKSSDEEK